MSHEEKLSAKHETLVGMAASIAAGCRPCTRRWLQAARSVAAGDLEIRLAVATGLAIREAATREMADFADAQLGSAGEPDETFRAEQPLLVELLSCGAAIGAQTALGLERHIDSARGYSATIAQISTAVGIGRTTRKMAGEEAEKVARRAGLDEAPTFSGPWCCEALSNGSVAPKSGCGCSGERP